MSEDDRGDAAGVKRQLEDARRFSDARGWRVVAEHSDNDISASNGVHRPGYQALLTDISNGKVNRVVVFHSSRLWRNRRERAEGIELLQSARVSVTAVKGPELDLSTAYGRGMAGMLGEFDTMESEVKSERIERAALQRAENGGPNGAIPYGWQRIVDTNDRGVRTGSHDVVHPDQGPVVAEICRRLLRGESLRSVTDWLNDSGVSAPGARFALRHRERGIGNPDGSRWGKTSVRKLALRPANAGLRLYHTGKPDERLLPANIEPIVARDEWERLRILLTSPERRTSRPGSRRHLLTWGIGACGVCGSVLRVASKGNARGTRQLLYVCDAKGCVGRNQASVDSLVRRIVIARLSRPDAVSLLFAGDDDRANAALDRAAGLRARLEAAADDYADARITLDQMRRITSKLSPRIKEAEQEAAAARPDVPVDLLASVVGDVAGDRWDALSVTQRRAVLAALIDAVVIERVARRGPGFDPASVRTEWRDARSSAPM